MRIADRLLRQGHLSEQALTAAVMGGDRPDHLDRCAICSERAFEIGRWLEQTRAEALAAADEAFPPERLAVQQNQILRRIAQLEEPVRVIEFPRQHVSARAESGPRRVSPVWLGVAAAAGLAVGVVGGHVSAHLEQRGAPLTASNVSSTIDEPLAPTGPLSPVESATDPATGLLDLDLEGAMPPSLQDLDDNTPRLTQVAMN